MANRFAKLEERLAALENRANTSGRWISSRIFVHEGDNVDDAIAAERIRLRAEHAPIVKGDQIHITVRIIVSRLPWSHDGDASPVRPHAAD